MSELTKGGMPFIGYDYKEVSAQNELVSMYLDGYQSFGWFPDENGVQIKTGVAKRHNRQVNIKLKRDRKILNKTELTRLQQHFEACMEEIVVFERAKTLRATMVAIVIGLIGTVFVALSTFAITHEPPLVLPCILLAIPGFIGWVMPYFAYKAMFKRQQDKISPLIEQKFDEIYEVCEKGNKVQFVNDDSRSRKAID